MMLRTLIAYALIALLVALVAIVAAWLRYQAPTRVIARQRKAEHDRHARRDASRASGDL